MRSVDGDNTFQPLGPAKPRPAPAAPTLPQPTGTPGIVRNPDGRLGTNFPENDGANATVPPFPYYGNWQTWGRAIESIRRGR
jgi:hypothetical protein